MTLRVRAITNAEGNRLLRLTRTTNRVVTMRRAQAVLHSAQGFSPPRIAAMLFMSPDWVRHILRRFDADGFESLYARYRGGGTVKFDDEVRLELVHLALSRPRDLGLPYNEWSLPKLREEAVRRGIVPAISPERLRQILNEEAVTFQAAKTWKVSNDPEFEPKKRRIERLTRKRKNPPTVLAIDVMGPPRPRPEAACTPPAFPFPLIGSIALRMVRGRVEEVDPHVPAERLEEAVLALRAVVHLEEERDDAPRPDRLDERPDGGAGVVVLRQVVPYHPAGAVVLEVRGPDGRPVREAHPQMGVPVPEDVGPLLLVERPRRPLLPRRG